MESRAYEPTIEQASGWQKLLAKIGFSVFLGYGRRSGWSGELPFYLFKCPSCKQLAVNYPHSHRQYLPCSNCER